MLLGIIEKNGQKSWVPYTSDARIGNPLGTILAIYTTRCPVGYLPCDGSAYDTTQYPALYALLGSDHLPDLREATLKGIGLNSQGQSHLTTALGIGDFLDDRLQNIKYDGDSFSSVANWTDGSISPANSPFITSNLSPSYSPASGQYGAFKGLGFDASRVARTGVTTEVKSVGVFYVIKAVPGVEESQADYVAGVFEDYVDNVTDNIKMKFIYISWGPVTASQSYTKVPAELGLDGKQLVGFSETETGGPNAYDNHQIHIAYTANRLVFDCTITQSGCGTYGVIFYR